MEQASQTTEKKGMGPLAWLGLGCGGILLAVLIGIFTFWMKFGGEFREMAAEAQKNPARAAAMGFVKVGKGKFEMLAEDEPGKRYTVREVATGKLMTFYWSSKTNTIEMAEGDFSAIPGESGTAKPTEKTDAEKAAEGKSTGPKSE